MLVTLPGIVIFLRYRVSKNAPEPIKLILSGIVYSVFVFSSFQIVIGRGVTFLSSEWNLTSECFISISEKTFDTEETVIEQIRWWWRIHATYFLRKCLRCGRSLKRIILTSLGEQYWKDVKRQIESGVYCKLISAISPLELCSLFTDSMILVV